MIFDKLHREAQANSVSFWDYNPTLTDEIKNSIGSFVSGVYTGLVAKPSTLLGGAMVSAMEKLDELAGMESDSKQTEYLKNSLAATVKQTQLMQETAQNIGAIDSTIYSIADVLSTYVGAGKVTKGIGPVSTTAGTVHGYADYEQGLAEGVDKGTAAQKGFVAGGSIALGGYVPLTMGFRFSPAAKSVIESQTKLSKAFTYGNLALQDVTYTAGANVAIGSGYRGFTHEILKTNGYDQMANQYKALDDTAMVIDAAFGLIFGGVAKYAEIRQQNIVDALLAKNNQIHQTDSAMGIPTDAKSLNMHDKAFNKAFEDRIKGKDVDVGGILKDSNFILKNDVDWQNAMISAIAKQFPDEALYYTKNGTAIPNKVIAEIKNEIINKKTLTKQDKADIVNLNNGVIPKHLTQKVIDKTGLKASDVKESFSIYEKQQTVSDSEFKSMQDKALHDDLTAPDVIDQLLRDKPEMVIKFTDDSGLETSIKASELLESVNREVEQAKADKQLYEAAVTCMLRNS